MPKHKINGKKLPPRDPLMELVKGRIQQAGIKPEDIQKALGLSESAARVRLRKGGGEWKIRDLCRIAKCIGIPVGELLDTVDERYYC